MSPEMKVLNAINHLDGIRQEVEALAAKLQKLQELLMPRGPHGDIVMIEGVPHRFYPGTGWVQA
jgi:hypothetical protein